MKTETTEIAEYSPTQAALAELKNKFGAIVFDVKSSKGMKEAREARSEIKGYRTSLEKKRVEIKGPALERCKLIDSEAKRIEKELRALEEPIDEAITAEEERKEAEKQAKLLAEQQRIAKIHDAIQTIRMFPIQFINSPAIDVEVAFQQIKVGYPDESFEELRKQAIEVWQVAVTEVETILEQRIAAEEKEARIKAEMAELARFRAEQDAKIKAEREAEAKRQAEEDAKRWEALKAEEERIAVVRKVEQEEREKIEQRLRAEHEMLQRQRAEQEEKARLLREQQEEVTRQQAALEEKLSQDKEIEGLFSKPTATEEPRAAVQQIESRPTDDEIIEVLAMHFRAHEMTVVAWLIDMDLEAASNTIAAEFA